MQINRILVPTDFSDHAELALRYAIDLAKRTSASLHLLHVPVIPASLLLDASYNPGADALNHILAQSQQALDAVSKRAGEQGLEVIAALHEGVVHEAIHDYAREQDVDLVVMGTHGRTGVSKLIFGSVTERVLKTVHTPILVVPEGDTKPPNSIVIGYDFSEPAKRAAEVARAIHGAFHGPLHLVHTYLDVWAEYTDGGAVDGSAAAQRREALVRGLQDMLETDAKELFSIDAQGTQTHLVAGDAAKSLIEIANEVGATLICIGTTGKSGLDRLLMGSVARRLLHESKVPILLAHEGDRDVAG